MSGERLRWGIMGTGNIARQFAAGVREARRSIMTAVGSRTVDAAARFAGDHEIPQSFGSYDELLRCEEVDAVYISLPNSMHHAWTLSALAAGKHVLCEKPIAVNAREAQEMFAAAERAGRVLMEAFMYRSHPLTHAVLNAVRGGMIGTPRLIRTSFCYRTTRIAGNIRFDPALAGGALMDVGCYCVDFARLIAGAEPEQVNAIGHLHPSGVDELVTGSMRFADSSVASFTCGMCVQADNSASICGTEGFIEIPVPWKPPVAQAQWRLARGTPPRMDQPGVKTAPTAPPIQHFTLDAALPLYAMEADDFAMAVLDGAPPRVSASDSLSNMRVLDQLHRDVYGSEPWPS